MPLVTVTRSRFTVAACKWLALSADHHDQIDDVDGEFLIDFTSFVNDSTPLLYCLSIAGDKAVDVAINAASDGHRRGIIILIPH